MSNTEKRNDASRRSLDPHRPHVWFNETETDCWGMQWDCTTVILTASACPVGCSMCDLWKNTLRHPTPPGAITAQIDFVLDQQQAINTEAPDPLDDPMTCVKLYNSGNFFDANSIPPPEYDAIAQRCQRFDRMVVENHPAFSPRRMLQFNEIFQGQLEVAVGLETVQPRWLARMGKRISRDQFDAFARLLVDHGIDLRVFLIVGVPGISASEAMRWTRLSVRHAVLAGARHISLIPARVGHGWNNDAERLPAFQPAMLEDLLESSRADTRGFCAVELDRWGLSPTEKG